jgi:hypothetical protein
VDLHVKFFFFFFFRDVAIDVYFADWFELENSLFWDWIFEEIFLGPFGLFPLFEEAVHLVAKSLAVGLGVDQTSWEGHIEVWDKIFDVDQEGVAIFIDGVDLDDRSLDAAT